MAKAFTVHTGDLLLYALYLKKRGDHSAETSITYEQYNNYFEAVRENLTSNFINHGFKAGLTTPRSSLFTPDVYKQVNAVYYMNDTANQKYTISPMIAEDSIRARVLAVFPTFFPSLLEPEGYEKILGIKQKAPEPGDEN